MIGLLTTCELPPQIQAGHLQTNYGTGTVIVLIARTGAKNAAVPLLRDLIAATADERDPKAMPKAEATLANIALARLIGYRVEHVLVCSSENLPLECLTVLTELVITAGSRLTLLYGFDSGEALRKWGTAAGATDIEWDTLTADLPAPVTNDNAEQGHPSFPEEVPWVDFPLFRSACRSLLTQQDFEYVDEVYRTAFRAVRAARPRDTAEAAALLQRLLQDVDSASQAIVIVRAAQSACLAKGHLLKVDLNRLYLLVSQSVHRRMNHQELLALRDQVQPHMAAIPVLADAGLDNSQIGSLRIGDVDRDGSPAVGASVAEPGRQILRVQRLFRLLEGAQPHDPFIEDHVRLIPRALRLAARMGAPVDASRATTAKADRWQHQTGVHLQEIA